MADNKTPVRKWRAQFDERQKKQIDFARLYIGQFNHGADGHNAMQIIDKMSFILDAFDTMNTDNLAENKRLVEENKSLREQLVRAGIDFEPEDE